MRVAPWMLASGLCGVGVAAAFSCNPPTNGDNNTVTFAAVTTASVTGSSSSHSASSGSTSHSATATASGSGGMGGAGGMAASMSSAAMSSSTGPLPVPLVNDCNFQAAPCDANSPKPGCLLDLTGAGASINIQYPGGTTNPSFSQASINGSTRPLAFPLCIKIHVTQQLNMCVNPPSCTQQSPLGAPLFVGGTVDTLANGGIKSYDDSSPIQPTCFGNSNPNGSFDVNNGVCFQGGVWPCGKTPGNLPAGQGGGCQASTQKSWGGQPYPFYNNSNPGATNVPANDPNFAADVGEHGAVFIVN